MNFMTNNQQTILLVENESNVVTLVTYNLEQAGFRVIVEENGKDALNALKTSSCDLIICDIMMPIMDGFELRQHIRDDPQLNLTPFIFLSAKAQMADKLIGLNLGVDDYITKPFEPQELIGRIKAILNRRHDFERLMNYDDLTQLLNRRALEARLSLELKKVKRYNTPLCILLLDLDNFKNINDTYGHALGDKVLSGIASHLRKGLREIDFAGRLGGEEFIVCMPDTTKDGCLVVSERMRKEAANLNWAEDALKITISGGIACAPEDGLTSHEILQVADSRMYKAKANGKNRIVLNGSSANENFNS